VWSPYDARVWRWFRRRPARTAIYTAIYGGYDRLAPQPELDGVDWVCFTDNAELMASPWTTQVEPSKYRHPRLSAKWFKTHPHRAVGEYQRTIWIDGNMRVTSPTFVHELLEILGDQPLAIFPHPDRDNIFDEADESAAMPKYHELPVFEQVQHYRRQGFIEKELYACGVLVRDNVDRRMRRLNEAWLAECLRWTYQDQLSLPYLLWRHNVRPALIPYNLWDNHLIEFQPHLSDL
jgi:hypothetical protein